MVLGGKFLCIDIAFQTTSKEEGVRECHNCLPARNQQGTSKNIVMPVSVWSTSKSLRFTTQFPFYATQNEAALYFTGSDFVI